jgi:nucleotide-binding universal stress UspA family protein
MMENILLATDLKTETNRALDRAVKLASRLSAKLHILHVCHLYSWGKKKKQSFSLKKDTEEMLKVLLSKHKDVKNIQTSITIIEGGEIYGEILKHAEKVNAGLIIMGMHNKKKFSDMFVGTTIERVIRKGVKPVLMVKDQAHNNYKTVLVGTDFSDGSRQAFRVAATLVPKAAFRLVHIYGYSPFDLRDHTAWYTEESMAKIANEKLEEFAQKNEKMLKHLGVEGENVYLEKVRGDTCSSLLSEVTKGKNDLIAIGTHSHLTLMPNTLGGTAKAILSNPPCDVLIAKGL